MEETMDNVKEETMDNVKEEAQDMEERMTRKDKVFLALTGVASAAFGFAVGWTARGAKEKGGENKNENAE